MRRALLGRADLCCGPRRQLQEELEQLRGENQRLRGDLALQQETAERQRRSVAERHLEELAKAATEKELFVQNAQSELRLKMSEVSQRCSEAVRGLEQATLETTRCEWAGERLREMMALQKQCALDVERVRAEERQRGLEEVQRVRGLFADRESRTGSDLLQLEKLHSARVQVGAPLYGCAA